MSICLVYFIATNSIGQNIPAINEFLRGNTQKYVCKSDGKSKGVNFSLKYPQSWYVKEGERPNVVKKIKSADETEMLIILITELDIPHEFKQFLIEEGATMEDLASELLTEDFIKEMIPKNATFIKSETNLIIDGQTAGSVDYLVKRDIAGLPIKLHIYFRSFVFFYKNFKIELLCSVGVDEQNRSGLIQRFSEYEILFGLMVNSFVLTSKWK